MSEPSPYELLGVTEDASFEEVQEARGRLAQQYSDDQRHLQTIEAAYDAILMERLRMRQEGKIKVPERIRFPERVVEPTPEVTPLATNTSPAWLKQWVDTPSRTEVLWSTGVFLGLGLLSFYPVANDGILQLTLALGVGANLYFLNRKEHKFGRSVLLTVGALIVGLLLGGVLGATVPLSIVPGLTAEKLITLVTFLIMWLVSSFVR